MLAAHAARQERLLDLGDVDRGDEDVIADRRQQAVGNEQHAGLLLGRQGQYRRNQRAEQLLLVDDRDHGKEHHQQRGEWHGVLESAA